MEPSQLQAIAALSAAATAIMTYCFTRTQAASQQLLAQRQMLVSIWSFIADLNDIDPNAPITPDVVKACNTLHLIAISCSSGIVDETLIKLTFRDTFIELYESIEKCSALPGHSKTGKTLLSENRSIVAFYDKLVGDKKREIAEMAKVPKLGGG